MKLKLELRLTALKLTLKPVVVALTTIFKRGFPILCITCQVQNHNKSTMSTDKSSTKKIGWKTTNIIPSFLGIIKNVEQLLNSN